MRTLRRLPSQFGPALPSQRHSYQRPQAGRRTSLPGDAIPTASAISRTSVTNPVCIAAGGFHSLALNADGTVAAWGKNWDGQTNVPTAATNVVAVAAGGNHSLALKGDGSVLGLGPRLGWADRCAPCGHQCGCHRGGLGP